MIGRSIFFDKDHEIYESEGVYAEVWDGVFKIRFKDNEQGRKLKEMYKKLCEGENYDIIL